jgi:hypothetical protein
MSLAFLVGFYVSGMGFQEAHREISGRPKKTGFFRFFDFSGCD